MHCSRVIRPCTALHATPPMISPPGSGSGSETSAGLAARISTAVATATSTTRLPKTSAANRTRNGGAISTPSSGNEAPVQSARAVSEEEGVTDRRTKDTWALFKIIGEFVEGFE